MRICVYTQLNKFNQILQSHGGNLTNTLGNVSQFRGEMKCSRYAT